jgi:CRP-like cAMP-binding protein
MPKRDLNRVSLFEKLDPEEIELLETIVRERTLGANTIVFSQDDDSDSMYIIASGSAKVYSKADDGTEKVLTTLATGDIFGESALVGAGKRSATVETMEPTDLMSISHQHFRQFAGHCPDLLWKVLEALIGRIQRMTDEHVEYASRDVPSRLIRVLCQLGEKHGEASEQGCRIKIEVKPQILAGMVGSSPERVSRLLGRFQAEGLVRNSDHDRLVIPDLQVMKRALELPLDWS